MRAAGDCESVECPSRSIGPSRIRNTRWRANRIAKDNAISGFGRQAFGGSLAYSARVNSFRIRFACTVLNAIFLVATAEGQQADRDTALLNPRAIAVNPATGDVYAVAPQEGAVMSIRAGGS